MVFSHQSKTTTTDKINVEPVHFYDAFHTWFVGPGMKGTLGMHRFNICLVVVLLWCENTIIVHILFSELTLPINGVIEIFMTMLDSKIQKQHFGIVVQ